MSEPKFTPGPWHWVDADNDSAVSDRTWVASLRTVEKFAVPHSSWNLPKWIVNTDGGKGDISDADAHLIAAAPDLYAALEQMICAFGHEGGSAIEQSVAALAKARGETGDSK